MTDLESAPRCIACGMPMRTPAEHAQGDTTKVWCVHCARPDGSMRSWDEAVAGMTAFMVRTQGVDEGAARARVVEMLDRLPAWQDRPKG